MSLERFSRPLATADAADTVKRAACSMRDPLTVTVHDTFETAAALPIVNDDGAVGIVTSDDLLVILGRSLADVCEGIENRSDATESCWGAP